MSYTILITCNDLPDDRSAAMDEMLARVARGDEPAVTVPPARGGFFRRLFGKEAQRGSQWASGATSG